MNLLTQAKRALFTAAVAFGITPARAATFEIVDAVEFNKIIDTNAVFTTNATISALLEGPVWIPTGSGGAGYLLFCDQGNNKLKKLVLPNTVTDFIAPATGTLFNGTCLDAQERLIAAQAGTNGLRIVMVTNGVTTTLVSTCNGLKFYSPNDVTVKSDGTIWFTDPGFNGNTLPPPQPGYQGGYHVYQFNPTNGNATCTAVITNGLTRPNGLCFSPDETRFYVADWQNKVIKAYSVSPSNTVSGGTTFCTVTNGNPDGIRCDVDGRIWSSSGEGVYIFAPTDGHLIGKIKFRGIANLCFGGPGYKTLYLTGNPLVTSFPVKVAGTPALKKLQQGFVDGKLTLAWPAPSTGFLLEETDGLTTGWSNATSTVTVTNGRNTVTLDAVEPAKYFRLRLN